MKPVLEYDVTLNPHAERELNISKISISTSIHSERMRYDDVLPIVSKQWMYTEVPTGSPLELWFGWALQTTFNEEHLLDASGTSSLDLPSN